VILCAFTIPCAASIGVTNNDDDEDDDGCINLAVFYGIIFTHEYRVAQKSKLYTLQVDISTK